MDEIRIKALKLYGYHGVFEFEKEEGQNFYVNATLKLDTQMAGLTDDLTRSVSYADVCCDIEQHFKDNIYNLIETAAENVAIMILDKYKLISEVMIEICKPEAPVTQEVENLSVCITRARHTAYIAYGSNMGDSMATIESALADIDADRCCNITKKSKVVVSSPYGGVEQDDFYNGVIELSTYYEPNNLLMFLQEIEKKYGRIREVHWGPRTLDLDIIMYDDLVISSEMLIVPHPDMLERDFVMKPLAEIAGYRLHPIEKKTIEKLASKIDSQYIKQ